MITYCVFILATCRIIVVEIVDLHTKSDPEQAGVASALCPVGGSVDTFSSASFVGLSPHMFPLINDKDKTVLPKAEWGL